MNKTPARVPAAAVASRIVVFTTVAAVCAACGLLPQAPRHAAGRTRDEHRVAAPRNAATGPASPAAALMPVSPASLQSAAAVAARFAGMYETVPQGGPGAWLARLRPIVTGQLYGALARAVATPGLMPRGTASALVTSEKIRVLAAESVIFTVTSAQPAAGGPGLSSLAVTVVRAGGGWLVYDVEPASAGDFGGGP